MGYSISGASLGNITYTYDKDGRRTSVGGSLAHVSLPAALLSASYNAANELTSWAGGPLLYDDAGRLTGDGANSYTWNPRGELVAISGSQSATFAYDALGRRVMDARSATILYDGFAKVQETLPGPSTATYLNGIFLDEVFARLDAAGAHIPVVDAMGSTNLVINGTGTTEATYTYEPFGRTAVSGPNTNLLTSQFTGRDNDSVAGLYYYRSRYYNPGFQRFISEDPVGPSGTGNLYVYADNAPTMHDDPSGMYSIDKSCYNNPPFDVKKIDDAAREAVNRVTNTNCIKSLSLRQNWLK